MLAALLGMRPVLYRMHGHNVCHVAVDWASKELHRQPHSLIFKGVARTHSHRQEDKNAFGNHSQFPQAVPHHCKIQFTASDWYRGRAWILSTTSATESSLVTRLDASPLSDDEALEAKLILDKGSSVHGSTASTFPASWHWASEPPQEMTKRV